MPFAQGGFPQRPGQKAVSKAKDTCPLEGRETPSVQCLLDHRLLPKAPESRAEDSEGQQETQAQVGTISPKSPTCPIHAPIKDKSRTAPLPIPPPSLMQQFVNSSPSWAPHLCDHSPPPHKGRLSLSLLLQGPSEHYYPLLFCLHTSQCPFASSLLPIRCKDK